MELITTSKLAELNSSFINKLSCNEIEKRDVCALIIKENIPDIIEYKRGNYHVLVERIKRGYYQVKSLQPNFCITPDDYKEHVRLTGNEILINLLNW